MKRRNCHVLIVTTFYQCSSSKESNEMTSVTQKLERDFLEAISEEMNSSQNRIAELIAHITALLFSTVMNIVLCLKSAVKKFLENLLPKMARCRFIICPTG